MAKFVGAIGYSVSEETAPGVWTNTVIERNYTGDVLKNTSQWRDKGNVNPDSVVSDTISIVADGTILDNLYSMKYVKWRGQRLSIVSIQVARPRVIIEIGGLFSGITANVGDSSSGE